jgi:hypothetical protein
VETYHDADRVVGSLLDQRKQSCKNRTAHPK